MISKWKHWLHILPVHVAEGILLACQQAPSKGGKKKFGDRKQFREQSEWESER